MSVVAGVLSACIAFVFVYSQGPIVANLSRVNPGSTVDVTVGELPGKYDVKADGTIAIKGIEAVAVGGLSAQEASKRIEAAFATGPEPRDVEVHVTTGSIAANVAVWALAMLGGAAVNLGYAVYLMAKNNSWGVLFGNPKEAAPGIANRRGVLYLDIACGHWHVVAGSVGSIGRMGHSTSNANDRRARVGDSSAAKWRGVHGRPRNANVRGHCHTDRGRSYYGLWKHVGEIMNTEID